MLTKLDNRTELIKIVEQLNHKECRMVSVFLAGLEAGKDTNKTESTDKKPAKKKPAPTKAAKEKPN